MRSQFNAVLNGEVFTSKKQMKDRVRQVLFEVEGSWAKGESEKFLRDLIKRHPAYLESRDGIEEPIFYIGVDAISYGPNDGRFPGSKGMFIRTKKYRDIRFISYLKCVDGETKSHYQRLAECFRREIAPQIMDFKKATFAGNDCIMCPISGRELTFNNCHVDHHRPQFKELMNDFIASRGVDPTRLQFIKRNNDSWTITDSGVIDDWKQYHNRRAVLRVISVEENLKRKKAS